MIAFQPIYKSQQLTDYKVDDGQWTAYIGSNKWTKHPKGLNWWINVILFFGKQNR